MAVGASLGDGTFLIMGTVSLHGMGDLAHGASGAWPRKRPRQFGRGCAWKWATVARPQSRPGLVPHRVSLRGLW